MIWLIITLSLALLWVAGLAWKYRAEARHYKNEMHAVGRALMNRVNDVQARDRAISSLQWQVTTLTRDANNALTAGAVDAEIEA